MVWAGRWGSRWSLPGEFCVEEVRVTFLGGEVGDFVAVSGSTGLACEGADARAGEFAGSPCQIDFKGAACAEAVDGAGVPGLWERGEEFDFAGMGLEEHFGEAGGAAEAAVDWEGWAGIEHIGVGSFGAEEHGEVFVGVLGVLESRAEVQPSAAGRGDRDGMEKRDDVQQDKAFLFTGGGVGRARAQRRWPKGRGFHGPRRMS